MMCSVLQPLERDEDMDVTNDLLMKFSGQNSNSEMIFFRLLLMR